MDSIINKQCGHQLREAVKKQPLYCVNLPISTISIIPELNYALQYRCYYSEYAPNRFFTKEHPKFDDKDSSAKVALSRLAPFTSTAGYLDKIANGLLQAGVRRSTPPSRGVDNIYYVCIPKLNTVLYEITNNSLITTGIGANLKDGDDVIDHRMVGTEGYQSGSINAIAIVKGAAGLENILTGIEGSQGSSSNGTGDSKYTRITDTTVHCAELSVVKDVTGIILDVNTLSDSPNNQYHVYCTRPDASASCYKIVPSGESHIFNNDYKTQVKYAHIKYSNLTNQSSEIITSMYPRDNGGGL